jgi:hypothetical protein
MNCSLCSSLIFFMLIAAQGQRKTAPKAQPQIAPKTTTLNCSDTQTTRACNSFKQLLEAHDKDILASLSTPTSYVCFRPKEDAFLIFHLLGTLGPWEKLEGAKEIKWSSQAFAEFRDGVLYYDLYAIGAWNRMNPSDTEPVFKSSNVISNDDATVYIDAAEILVSYPFKNQNGGTTQYSLTIRRSTGRFIETFAIKNTPSSSNSGTCLIYR